MAAQETRIITKFLRERPDDSWTIDAAIGNGAYEGLKKALTMAPEDIITEVQTSGLRGRGGAGFGTGQKWSFLPKDVFPRYLAVNGDEGEPSTFKDHMLVERDPHQVIEGVIITSFAIQCHTAFIYLRGEFGLGAERLGQAIADAYDKGFVGKNILGSGFDLEIVAAPRRRLLHRRRRDGPALEPRRRARDAAHQAAVPRGAGRVRGAHDRQQHRDHVDGAAHHQPRWRVVRRDGRQPLHRHAPLLGVGQRRAARQLRGRARHDVPRAHRRPRRRHQGRQEARVLHPRRRVVALADRGAPRRAARHGLRAERAQGHARIRARSWCSTRPSTRCWSRGASPSSSPTSRAASARRAARVRAGWRRCSTAWRTATAAPRTWTCCSAFGNNLAPGMSWPPGHDHDLPAGSEHMSPTVEPAQLLVRRDQGAHGARQPRPAARSPSVARGSAS